MDEELPLICAEGGTEMVLPSPVCPVLDRRIDETAQAMARLPQVECPLVEFFHGGVYTRTLFMPSGTAVIGCKHKTAHINIVTGGVVRVMMDGAYAEIDAREKPVVFESLPGVRKVLHIIEGVSWTTVHETTERDPKKLADLLIENPSDHELYLAKVELQKLTDELQPANSSRADDALPAPGEAETGQLPGASAEGL
jgi:hypothetical protein